MADKSFHLFPKLPAELRIQIWQLCLPFRVHELDFPIGEYLYIDNDDGIPLPCRGKPSADLNGLPPVITRVCHESRNVAYESGGVAEAEFYRDMPYRDRFTSYTSVIADKYWLDRKRDTVHINWSPTYQCMQLEDSVGSALGYVAWVSRQLLGHPSPSITDDWFDDMCITEQGRYSSNEYVPEVFDQVPSWRVIVRTVMIHTTFREAAQSGLFGLLGDASVQTVSLSDEEKINAFYDFADKHDRQLSTGETFQRVSSEDLEQKLKTDIIETMQSDKLLSKMHPAIMFRVCPLMCMEEIKRMEESRRIAESKCMTIKRGIPCPIHSMI